MCEPQTVLSVCPDLINGKKSEDLMKLKVETGQINQKDPNALRYQWLAVHHHTLNQFLTLSKLKTLKTEQQKCLLKATAIKLLFFYLTLLFGTVFKSHSLF